MGFWDFVLGRPTEEPFRAACLAGLQRAYPDCGFAASGSLELRGKRADRILLVDLAWFFARARASEDTQDEAVARVVEFVKNLVAGASSDEARVAVTPKRIPRPGEERPKAPPPKKDPVETALAREAFLECVKPILLVKGALEGIVVDGQAVDLKDVVRAPLRSKVFEKAYAKDLGHAISYVMRHDLERLEVSEADLDDAAHSNLDGSSGDSDGKWGQLAVDAPSGVQYKLGAMARFADALSSSRVFSARVRGRLRRAFPRGYRFATPNRDVFLAFREGATPGPGAIESFHRDEPKPLALGLHDAADFLPAGTPDAPPWKEATVPEDGASFTHLVFYAVDHPEDEPGPGTPSFVEPHLTFAKVDPFRIASWAPERNVTSGEELLLEIAAILEDRSHPATEARAALARLGSWLVNVRARAVVYGLEPEALAGDGTTSLRIYEAEALTPPGSS